MSGATNKPELLAASALAQALVPLSGDHEVLVVEARRKLVSLLPRLIHRAAGGTCVETTESQGFSQPELVLLVAVHQKQHPRVTLSRKVRRKRVSMRPRAQVRDARVIARFGAGALVAPLVGSVAHRRAARNFVACVLRKARTLAIASGMISIFGCDFKVTTRSALLLATRITAHFLTLPSVTANTHQASENSYMISYHGSSILVALALPSMVMVGRMIEL